MFSSLVSHPHVEKHPSPSFRPPRISPLHLSSVHLPLMLSISPSPRRHAPAVMWELQHCACGAVALAWRGGGVNSPGPEGVLLLLLLLLLLVLLLPSANWGYWAWKEEQLEDWRASGGQERPQRSGAFKKRGGKKKPWLRAQR